MQTAGSPFLVALVLLSVSMSAVAQMFLKTGVSGLEKTRTLSETLCSYATSPYVIGGFALYGFGAFLWLFVLARLPLSVAYPFVGLGFVLTMFIGLIVFQENVGPMRISGTLLIAAGCILVARSAA